MPAQRRPTTLARCTPRGRPGRRAVAALLAGLPLAACPSPAPGVVAGCDRASTRDRVFVGLYPIFYRAAQAAAAPDRVRGWKPAPLPTAAGYLRCDPDLARRPGRVRRAAIKLAAGLVLLDGHAKGRAAAPRVTLTLALPDFLRLVAGKLPPVQAFHDRQAQAAGRHDDRHRDAGVVPAGAEGVAWRIESRDP